MKARFAVLALLVVSLCQSAEAALPKSVTLTVTGMTGLDSTHNGTFTLFPDEGHPETFVFRGGSSCFGLWLSPSGQLELSSGCGQFHGTWTAQGDFWTVTTMRGMVGTTATIKANP